ncbi:hypothetical protein PR048_011773 [Dryococelus australis]|uniref:Uncharacterized protein n=1 Tax=Dryococelus australis TaxID=614101 RepID=A0ABQ9HMQ9_9NEOP|nr:hypothetical protein PR048_011773 [Dryococelus australis]
MNNICESTVAEMETPNFESQRMQHVREAEVHTAESGELAVITSQPRDPHHVYEEIKIQAVADSIISDEQPSLDLSGVVTCGIHPGRSHVQASHVWWSALQGRLGSGEETATASAAKEGGAYNSCPIPSGEVVSALTQPDFYSLAPDLLTYQMARLEESSTLATALCYVIWTTHPGGIRLCYRESEFWLQVQLSGVGLPTQPNKLKNLVEAMAQRRGLRIDWEKEYTWQVIGLGRLMFDFSKPFTKQGDYRVQHYLSGGSVRGRERGSQIGDVVVFPGPRRRRSRQRRPTLGHACGKTSPDEEEWSGNSIMLH